MQDKAVVVALSGGLDSVACALKLREAGYRVLGVHFKLGDSQQEAERAQSYAKQIGVECEVIDLYEEFQKTVVSYFQNEIRAGRTPAPCSFCNPNFKWANLIKYADSHGIHHIAMGHYVRLQTILGRVYVSRGVDSTKDQSYYLWDLDQSILARAIFPLGEMTKSQVKEYLQGRGFEQIASTRESMSLCFLPSKVSYGDYLRSEFDCAKGDVLDSSMRTIGSHNGCVLYTVGQKRGFDILPEYADKKWAVLRIDSSTNSVIVSSNDDDFYHNSFELCAWRLPARAFERSEHLTIMVRGLGRNPRGGCSFEQQADGILKVTLLTDKAWALAAGQPVVFYDGDLLLGGGYML